MYTTPQKRARPNGAYTLSRSSPPKGLFQDGIWHCNCKPRLPAAHFQVKKDGPNTGRWFYTCQEPKECGCGFFLWNEDAASREKEVVMGNKRSEPEKAGWMTGPERDRRTVEGHNAASNKFMADLKRKDEDEFGDWGLSADEERRLVEAVEREDEVPRKTEEFATPGLKRKWEDDTTNTTGIGSGNRFSDEGYNTASSRSNRFGLRSPSYTPTPGRFREGTDISHISEAPSVTSISAPNYDISGEVLSLLEGHKIDEEVVLDLQRLLDKHTLRISGIVKGRDITRLALKKKDEKIAELQKRIGDLENEREMDRKIMGCLRKDMREGVERRSRGAAARGRGKS